MRQVARRTGTTLVELLVVLVVLAVVSAAVAPALRVGPSIASRRDNDWQVLRQRAAAERRVVETVLPGTEGAVVRSARPSGLTVAESVGVLSYPSLRRTNAIR